MFIGVLFGAQEKAHTEVDNLLSLLGMAEEGGEDRGEDGGGAGERTRDELATLEEVRFLLDLQAKTAEERRGAAKVLRIRRRREYAY